MDEFAENRFIKVMRGAPTHRKFRRLARDLDVSRFEALGLTVALWDWFDANRPFGQVEGFTAEDLADSLGIDHIEPDKLLAAWISVGIVDEYLDGGYSIHGWLDEHRTGASARKRSEKATRAAYTRYHKSGDHAEDPHPECHLCPETATEHAPSHASEQPENYQGAVSEMPDVDARRRRETRDEDATHSITGVRANSDFEIDDSGRPFDDVTQPATAGAAT